MNKEFMKIAFKEAEKAFRKGNTPVGCVITFNNKIIAKAYNKKNSLNNAIYHAEIIAIRKACKKIRSWRLNHCSMYVTLEPCQMCMGAIVEARIKNVYYLLNSEYNSAFEGQKNKITVAKFTEDFEYPKLLSDFFKSKRNN